MCIEDPVIDKELLKVLSGEITGSEVGMYENLAQTMIIARDTIMMNVDKTTSFD